MSDEDLDQLLLDEAFPSEASSDEYDTKGSSSLSSDENESMFYLAHINVKYII